MGLDRFDENLGLSICLLHQCQHAHTARSIALYCATVHPTKVARQRVWGWLRKELCRRDLEDFPCEKPAISKVAYRARVRTVLRAQKAQRVAT